MTRKKQRKLDEEETDLDKGVEEMLSDALLLLAPDVERETDDDL